MIPVILLVVFLVLLSAASLVSALVSAPGRFLGNTLWFVLGGWTALGYYLVGAFLCLTIVGIPAGKQIIKIGRVAALPFGLEVQPSPLSGVLCTLGNVLWAVCFGWEMFLAHLASAVACAATIVGIPFAMQHVKLMAVCLVPFGCAVVHPRSS